MERADKRKHHYIYKTTCKINSKWYIGRHSTDNLDDGYVGSGTRLWHSINKHGKENHVCEILEFLPDRKTLIDREAELVNAQTLKDTMCMNLTEGGEGYTLQSCRMGGRNSKGGRISGKKTYKSALEKTRTPDCIEKIKKTRTERYGEKYNCHFEGKTHSEESKARISSSMMGKQNGEKNSQFGTCWVTDGFKPIKIKKDQLDEYIRSGYVKGRKKLISQSNK